MANVRTKKDLGGNLPGLRLRHLIPVSDRSMSGMHVVYAKPVSPWSMVTSSKWIIVGQVVSAQVRQP